MELTMQQREAARASLAARREERLAVLEELIAAGVQVMSEDIYVERGVQVAPGATLLPGTILRGATVIEAGCVVGPNSLLENTTLGEGSTFNASQAYDSQLGPHSKIGPFTHIRAGTVTGYGVHLGAYVETKNSTMDDGTTVSHLTYIGDSDVGKGCNFGCGTVTSNYDGQGKYRCTIGDYAFIGCNTNLIAPVKVGDGAYTAAGSTITGDVPAGALGIARERQSNKEGWAEPRLAAYVKKQQKKMADAKAADEAANGEKG